MINKSVCGRRAIEPFAAVGVTDRESVLDW